MNQLKEIYEEYKTGIYRYALSLLHDPHLAEDVLHDTFLKLLSGKYKVDFNNPGSWLYRVARNRCIDILRKRKWELPLIPEQENRSREYEYVELISGLDRKEQEIVTLRIVGNLSAGEIGNVMGISARAAQKRYERAIQKLRETEGIK